MGVRDPWGNVLDQQISFGDSLMLTRCVGGGDNGRIGPNIVGDSSPEVEGINFLEPLYPLFSSTLSITLIYQMWFLLAW